MKYSKFNSHPYEAHMLVFERVEPDSFVLDLGCATGYFAEALKSKNCKVVGVEFDKEASKIAAKHCLYVITKDLEQSDRLKLPEHKFDYILLIDVLEHLKNRELLLKTALKWLKFDGKLIVSTPNIAHLSIRLKLLFGDFTYTRWGILDENHLHFFTDRTLKEELIKSKWLIDLKTVSADFGQIPILGRLLRHVPKIWQYKITQLMPTLMGIQFVWRCKSNYIK